MPTLLIGFVELGLDLGAYEPNLRLLLLCLLPGSVPSPLPLELHLIHVLPGRGPTNHDARRLPGYQILWALLRLHFWWRKRVGCTQSGQKSQKWRVVLIQANWIKFLRLANAKYWRWVIDAIKALVSLNAILLRLLTHMRGCLEHQALRQAVILFNPSLVHEWGSVCGACFW